MADTYLQVILIQINCEKDVCQDKISVVLSWLWFLIAAFVLLLNYKFFGLYQFAVTSLYLVHLIHANSTINVF